MGRGLEKYEETADLLCNKFVWTLHEIAFIGDLVQMLDQPSLLFTFYHFSDEQA